jgi:hypothetical protein
MEKSTRRQVMTAATLSAAAAMVAPAAAQPADKARPPTEDPREKYPKPPFASQSQPWPGLASQMEPRPDHGETSYVGSGRLAGRRALITGGDSGMGAPQPSPTRGKARTWPSTTFPPRSQTRARWWR